LAFLSFFLSFCRLLPFLSSALLAGTDYSAKHTVKGPKRSKLPQWEDGRPKRGEGTAADLHQGGRDLRVHKHHGVPSNGAIAPAHAVEVHEIVLALAPRDQVLVEHDPMLDAVVPGGKPGVAVRKAGRAL